MPRARRSDPDEDRPDPLEKLELQQDPAPRATRHRRRPTDDDAPGPGRRLSSRSPAVRTTTTAALRASVQAELHTGLELLAGVWAVRDPVCSTVLTEPVQVPTAKGLVELDRTEAIAARIVNILARYPKVIKKLSETGVVMDFLMLGSLLWPIGVTIAAHHGPGGDRHEGRDEDLSAFAPHRAA